MFRSGCLCQERFGLNLKTVLNSQFEDDRYRSYTLHFSALFLPKNQFNLFFSSRFFHQLVPYFLNFISSVVNKVTSDPDDSSIW